MSSFLVFFFFFNDTATTEIYTLSLHDALPISRAVRVADPRRPRFAQALERARRGAASGGTDERSARVLSAGDRDRKSTRLNSSHSQISYAVFCLKKKNKQRVTWSRGGVFQSMY